MFILLILSIASFYFNRDANRLVLDPIDRITERVNIMASNPLAIVHDDIEHVGFLGAALSEEKKQLSVHEKNAMESYETAILERAII